MLAAVRDFRRTWPQLVVADLLARALAAVAVAPGVAALLKLFLLTTDDQVLTDADIAVFALHPLGLLAFGLVGAVTVASTFLRAGLLMVIGFGAVEDRRVTYLDALRYVARHVRAFSLLAVHLLGRLALLALPFLAGLGAVYAALLREHDINYYLTSTPREWWVALSLAGVLLAVLAALVVQRVTAWILALPLVLFEGVPATAALARSARATRAHRRRIAGLLVGWYAGAAVVSSAASYVFAWLAALLVPDLDGNLLVAVFEVGLIVLLASGTAQVVQTVAGCLVPLFVMRAYRDLAGPGALDPPPAERGTLAERPRFELPRRRILVGTAAALLATVAAAYAAARSLDGEEHAVIIAHRGASRVAPENTRAAFAAAVEQGADWIELDVQTSADGEVVVAHDRDFMKQARNPLRVRDATAADLRDLDVGSWFDPAFADERPPRLADVLAWARGKVGVVIELKYYGRDDALAPGVAARVEDAGMEADVMVMSLDRAGLAAMADLRPDWTRGLLNTASVGDLTRLDVDFLALNAAAASRAQIRRAHDRGMKVFVWTVNDPVQMSVLLSRGADGLITDEPALARDVLELREHLSPLGHLIVWMAGESGLMRDREVSSSAADA